MKMQRHQDTNGSGRWLGLLGVSALAFLAGCDWIGGSTPVGPPPRPGVERDVPPSAAIPPAPASPQYDAGVVVDDRAAPAIGSIVAGKGGQKAQRDAMEKDQAERDRKAREERVERDAAEKDAKAKETEQGPSPVAAPVGAPPVGAGSITSDQSPVSAPVSAPVPPPGPVTAAPIAPPSAAPPSAAPLPESPAAPATAPMPTAPTPPGDPNKAFTPPPDWTPPATPTAPADPNKAEAPPSGGMPARMTAGAFAAVAASAECGVLPAGDVTLAVSFPAGIVRVTEPAGDISRAQSGKVPFSALKSPPFEGQIQVAVIQFARGSSGLDETDTAVLARVARIQSENGGTVRVVAHAAEDVVAASTTGLERGNFDVSRRRAIAIAQELRRLGVPAGQILAEAASDDEPVYGTGTARGIAANRRADVFIDF